MARGREVLGGGVIEIFGPEGTTRIPTFTCCHCNRPTPVPKEGASQIGFCQNCHARECIGCGQRLQGACEPFMKQIEAYEARMRMLAAVG